MRVVVVGAGAIGCAIAFALADRGVAVLVFERATIGSGASGAAAGMLAPFSESPKRGPLFEAGAEALAEFADWRAAIEEAAGIDLEASSGGGLLLACDAEQVAELRSRLIWQSEIQVRPTMQLPMGRPVKRAPRWSVAHLIQIVCAVNPGVLSTP